MFPTAATDDEATRELQLLLTKRTLLRDNLAGTFVSANITGTGAVSFAHNLDVSLQGFPSSAPNVGWVVIGLRHSGAGATADGIVLEYQTGDSVTTNAIELRARYGGRTVASGANSIDVLVWFFPYGEGIFA